MAVKCKHAERLGEKRNLAGSPCNQSRRTCCQTLGKHFVTRLNFTSTVFIFYVLTTVASAIEEIESSRELGLLENCVDVEGVTSEVSAGWPFSIDCGSLLENASYEWQYEDVVDIKCIITEDNASVILHESNVTGAESIYYLYDAYSDPYVIDSTSEENNNAVFYSYLINGGSCLKRSHTLTVSDSTVEQATCKNNVYPDELIFTREFDQGAPYLLNCVASANTFYLTNYEVTWYKGCEVINTTHHTEPEFPDFDVVVGTLEIIPEFESAGEYSCSVAHAGFTRFLSKTDVCVRYRQFRGPPSFIQITPEVTEAQVGQDITLTCGGESGTSLDSLSFSILWIKNNTENGDIADLCELHHYQPLTANEDKHTCFISSNNDEATECFDNPAEAENNQATGITIVNSSLTIRNFQKSDAGEYICRVLTTRDPVTVRFVVSEYTRDATDLLVIILPTVTGACLVLLILILLCVCVGRGDFKQRCKESIRNTTQSKGGNERNNEGIDNSSSSFPASPRQTMQKDLPMSV